MIRQIIPSEVCLKCLGCCRFGRQDGIWSPQLLDSEKTQSIFRNGKLHLLPNPEEGNFVCEFLEGKENRCKIYAQRPFECQLYPFLLNRRGKECFLAVDMRCPFVKENFSLDVFKEHAQYLINLLKDNAQIIHSYGEVLNLFPLNI